MKPVFADTFFWIALADSRDQGHQQAVGFARPDTVPAIVTTEEVLTEYLNFFAEAGPVPRSNAARNVRDLLKSTDVLVVPQSPESFGRGLQLYSRRLDKGYSLTDCVSMATMREQGIADVLTNDAHFAQEGFRAIFREQG